jgi:hypothetical protein
MAKKVPGRARYSVAERRRAVRYLNELVAKIGLAFHPDTPIKDYIFVKKGVDKKELQRKLDFVNRVLGKDVYRLGLKRQRGLIPPTYRNKVVPGKMITRRNIGGKMVREN